MTSSSWYRRGVWQFKGNREYTKAGYEAASLRFGEKDLEVDCSDRHFVITGANSGIGLVTAVEIAKRGGILHLVCHNAKSMKEARSHIITTTGNDRIYQHQVNLSRPKDVARWAEDFLQSYDRLDVLINNAGLLINERIIDDDNLETHFAIHVLAVHLMTVTLLPLLQRSKDPRVITVSSAGMLKVKLDPHDLNFENLKPYDGTLAYSQTKRQQVVMNFCYAQRIERVRFFSMHPGWVDTPGLQNALPDFYEALKDNLRTPLQGADTVIWLSISEAALTHPSGLFFQDRIPTPTHLPLAWTRTTYAEEELFMRHLDELQVKYCTSNYPLRSTSGRLNEVDENEQHRTSPEHSVVQENLPHQSTSLKEEECNEDKSNVCMENEARDGSEGKTSSNVNLDTDHHEIRDDNKENENLSDKRISQDKEKNVNDFSVENPKTDTTHSPQGNEAGNFSEPGTTEDITEPSRNKNDDESSSDLHKSRSATEPEIETDPKLSEKVDDESSSNLLDSNSPTESGIKADPKFDEKNDMAEDRNLEGSNISVQCVRDNESVGTEEQKESASDESVETAKEI